MTEPALTIGALATRSGTTTPTIRYYEQIGLLRAADRRRSGHRSYGDGDVRRLTFIRRCRDFGFPLDQVRRLVALVEDGDRSCEEVRVVGQEHLDAVRAKMAELAELERSLSAFVAECGSTCAGGATRDCTALNGLAGPIEVTRRTRNA